MEIRTAFLEQAPTNNVSAHRIPIRTPTIDSLVKSTLLFSAVVQFLPRLPTPQNTYMGGWRRLRMVVFWEYFLNLRITEEHDNQEHFGGVFGN